MREPGSRASRDYNPRLTRLLGKPVAIEPGGGHGSQPPGGDIGRRTRSRPWRAISPGPGSRRLRPDRLERAPGPCSEGRGRGV